eukprot:gene23321-27742_t
MDISALDFYFYDAAAVLFACEHPVLARYSTSQCKFTFMFLINLKIALRNLRKNLGFSFINIGGLALGMACCLLLLLYVNYEWSYDKQFKDKDRIYVSRINLNINGRIATTIANPDKLSDAARQSIPAIENAARMAMSGGDNKLF